MRVNHPARRILLVDDHPIFRSGIEAFLMKHRLGNCIHAGSAVEAMQSIQDHAPEIAIVDVTLGGEGNGIALIGRMKTKLPDLVIVVLSVHDQASYVLRALNAGARGYVRKTDPPGELLEAIHEVMNGRSFLSRRLRQKPIFRVLFTPEPLLSRLTDREAEVLQSIGKGNSTASIAQILGLSVKTIETYQAHIKEKLKLSNLKELAEFAVDLAFYQGMA
jgi:DNA-binding NarL/FixJ family response regulator